MHGQTWVCSQDSLSALGWSHTHQQGQNSPTGKSCRPKIQQRIECIWIELGARHANQLLREIFKALLRRKGTRFRQYLCRQRNNQCLLSRFAQSKGQLRATLKNSQICQINYFLRWIQQYHQISLCANRKRLTTQVSSSVTPSIVLECLTASNIFGKKCPQHHIHCARQLSCWVRDYL